MCDDLQARKIVSALRAFREQEDDMGPSPVQWHGPSYDKSNVSENGAGQWFRSWADELGAKCTSNVTRPLVVGVFQNQTEQEVCQIVKESGVDLVQLHGDEDWNRLGAAAPAGVCPLRSCTLKWLAMRRDRLAQSKRRVRLAAPSGKRQAPGSLQKRPQQRPGADC